MRTRVVPLVALALSMVTVLGSACSGDGNDDAAQARRFFSGADCPTLRATLDQSELAAALAGPRNLTRDLQRTARFLREAGRRAPDALAADVRVLARAYAALAEGARDVDWVAIGRGDAMATIPAARLARRLADRRFGAAAFAVARAAAVSCPD